MPRFSSTGIVKRALQCVKRALHVIGGFLRDDFRSARVVGVIDEEGSAGVWRRMLGRAKAWMHYTAVG